LPLIQAWRQVGAAAPALLDLHQALELLLPPAAVLCQRPADNVQAGQARVAAALLLLLLLLSP
jgi:hypothetical protein